MPRNYVRNEVPKRVGFDGLTSCYCKQCGREIWRQTNPQVRTVTKCQICILKEQGVENPEDHVLTQYYLSNDPTRIPTPIDADMSLEGGILLLQPDDPEANEKLPQSGGFFGTVKSLFKTLGFDQKPTEVPVSREVAKKKRTGGLYDDRTK
jgi:hypothetical protein